MSEQNSIQKWGKWPVPTHGSRQKHMCWCVDWTKMQPSTIYILLCLCRICCFRRSSTLLPQYHYAPQTWVRHLCIWSRQKHMRMPHQNAIALHNHIITKSYTHAICSQGLNKHEWAEAGSTSKAGSTPTRLLACLFVVLLSTCWHRCCGMSVHSSPLPDLSHLQLDKLLPWPANLTWLRPIGAMQTSNTYVYIDMVQIAQLGSNMCVYVYLHFSISKNTHLQERNET